MPEEKSLDLNLEELLKESEKIWPTIGRRDNALVSFCRENELDHEERKTLDLILKIGFGKKIPPPELLMDKDHFKTYFYLVHRLGKKDRNLASAIAEELFSSPYLELLNKEIGNSYDYIFVFMSSLYQDYLILPALKMSKEIAFAVAKHSLPHLLELLKIDISEDNFYSGYFEYPDSTNNSRDAIMEKSPKKTKVYLDLVRNGFRLHPNIGLALAEAVPKNISKFMGEEIQESVYSFLQKLIGFNYPLEKTGLKLLFENLTDRLYQETVLELVRNKQCRTLEEVAECAELNHKLKSSGYGIIKKISKFGSIKKVYLAEDNFGVRCALKRTILTEEKNRLIQRKNLTPDEMLKRDLIITPFKIKHRNLCSATPLVIGKETFILEELYDRTLEEMTQLMHRHRKFSAKGNDLFIYQNSPVPYLESLSPVSCQSMVLFPFSAILTNLMSQIASGLEECHKQGIIHDDLNFTNIGVKENLTAVISDFGMASLEGGIRERYDTNSVYLRDIRLFQDKKRPDFESDLWAFGAICYRIFTGRFPFSENPVIFSPEEKEKYLKTIQELSANGKWEEKIKDNFQKYFPSALEIGYFVFEEDEKIKGRWIETTEKLDDLSGLILRSLGINPYRSTVTISDVQWELDRLRNIFNLEEGALTLPQLEEYLHKMEKEETIILNKDKRCGIYPA